jgi:uncharacterized protein YkwD
MLKRIFALLLLYCSLLFGGDFFNINSNINYQNTLVTIPNPIPFNAPSISSKQISYILSVVNSARVKDQVCGGQRFSATSKFRWNNMLYKAAYEHTYDMVYSSFFSHYGSASNNDWTYKVQNLSRASYVRERAENNGYSHFKALGENVASGYPTLEQTLQQWLSSPGHCRLLMNPRYKEIGLAYMHKSGDPLHYRHYWTIVFGDR